MQDAVTKTAYIVDSYIFMAYNTAMRIESLKRTVADHIIPGRRCQITSAVSTSHEYVVMSTDVRAERSGGAYQSTTEVRFEDAHELSVHTNRTERRARMLLLADGVSSVGGVAMGLALYYLGYKTGDLQTDALAFSSVAIGGLMGEKYRRAGLRYRIARAQANAARESTIVRQ